MKKKLLPLAMLAGLAGVAGTAQANHINPDGLGQVLIYPYYTTEGGNNTNIHIVNTTNEFKAVKVRFLEGENSQEVLDFNLYLSPWDEWTGAVILSDTAPAANADPLGRPTHDNANPASWGAKLVTADTSCTVPAIPANGAAFRTNAYSTRIVNNQFAPTTDANRGLNRTREGYIEVIEMGVLGSQAEDGTLTNSPGTGLLNGGIVSVIKHSATSEAGVPGSPTCTGLGAAWVSGGATPGAWNSDRFLNISAPTGGLYGYGVIVGRDDGTSSAYSAVAVDNFMEIPNHTNPGSLDPSLANADLFSDVFDSAAVVGTNFLTGRDAISSVFMRNTLANDYVVDTAYGAKTDWVLTFPTKRFYSSQVTLPARAPFSTAWNGSSACEHISVTYLNREEGRPTVAPEEGGFDFSPMPPQLEDVPEGFNLCSEVNIVTFNAEEGVPGALKSSDRLTYNLQLNPGYVEGWASIDLTQAIPPGGSSANYNARVISGANENGPGINTFSGLPVVGFAVQQYVNGDVNGVLSNYHGLVEHKFTRGITTTTAP